MREKLAILPLCLLLTPIAAAHTITPLILNVNRELKIVAAYPLEVKYSSWVRIVFDVTSTANVTVREMRVRLVLVHENGAATLFDGSIVRDKRMPPGHQVQRTVEFQASIPAPRPPVDPFLELYITIDYEVDGEARYYEHKSPISIVARATYSELTAALTEAQKKAQLADQLARQVHELELKLANASGVCAVLNEQVKKLRAENNVLKMQVGALQAVNASLSSRVAQLEAENVALRGELFILREERGGLASKLVNVESSYSALLAELNDLRQKYDTLTTEAANLKTALAAAATAAAALAVFLAVRARPRKSSRAAPLPPPPPPPETPR